MRLEHWPSFSARGDLLILKVFGVDVSVVIPRLPTTINLIG